MTIRQLLERDPSRDITSFIRITEHEPRKVWAEMDEYVPTEKVKEFFRDVLEVLSETRQGTIERVCVWIAGFFGSGKSHFLKTLGYILKDYELEDRDGSVHSSREFLCNKLGLSNWNPILSTEFNNLIIFINLLDNDPQSPNRPTISRLVYRGLLNQIGMSTEFWIAAWEKELHNLGVWENFLTWVRQTYRREWEKERRLNAEVVLRRALPALLPTHYKSEEEAVYAIQESKSHFSTVNPSDVVEALHQEALAIDPVKGRVVLLLDEVGLYIGDSVDKLTDLNALAEQVVQRGGGKVLMLATAQEALTDLVPRLTADRQILEWLRDRFRVRLGLEPTEVQTVVGSRLLAKTTAGAQQLRSLYRAHQGSLMGNLCLDANWAEADFVNQYPFPPYAVRLIQSIMGAMRGSIDEARRLSGAERSMIKLTQVLLTGEGGIPAGADQSVGWMAGLDSFYNALTPDLSVIRSEQVSAIREIANLGEVNGLSVQRVAKSLYMLQQVKTRYPCTVENIAASLVDRIDQDMNVLIEGVRQSLQKLETSGWVTSEEGKYRLLTREEHDLESEVRRNWPNLVELGEGTNRLIRELLGSFRYEHGNIRRPLKVAFTIDNRPYLEEGDLAVELFSPLAEGNGGQSLNLSIGDPEKIFWSATPSIELKTSLERVLAIQKTMDRLRARALTPMQQEHREHLEREAQLKWQTRLPELIQAAFLAGKVYVGGQEFNPTTNDFNGTLRSRLRELANQIFTEFKDARPDRDEDCSAILTWTPGTVLPAIYANLGLLTAGNNILTDADLLARIKAELQRRTNLGLERTGKELVIHFTHRPFGWDPRLIRTLLATLFKSGKVGLIWQGRSFTDPTNPQLQTLFSKDREFANAEFALLPDVDWRQAGEWCSRLFGVQGGDTFERVAATVLAQTQAWAIEAQQLGVRCRDNALPANYSQACQQAGQALQEISRLTDPNARLRLLLTKSNDLDAPMKIARDLKIFPFDEYRNIRSFSQATSEWLSGLTGDAAQRKERLMAGLTATDLLGRINQIKEDHTFLFSRYRDDYKLQHATFQQAVDLAIQRAREHQAFQLKPAEALEALQPLEALKCPVESVVVEIGNLYCLTCHRSLNGLYPDRVTQVRRQVEQALDNLLPGPGPDPGPILPLREERVVHDEDELNDLTEQLQRYLHRVGKPVQIKLDAKPSDEGG